jgi:hypothetical protein
MLLHLVVDSEDTCDPARTRALGNCNKHGVACLVMTLSVLEGCSVRITANYRFGLYSSS